MYFMDAFLTVWIEAVMIVKENLLCAKWLSGSQVAYLHPVDIIERNAENVYIVLTFLIHPKKKGN